jgi:hypothetical protein
VGTRYWLGTCWYTGNNHLDSEEIFKEISHFGSRTIISESPLREYGIKGKSSNSIMNVESVRKAFGVGFLVFFMMHHTQWCSGWSKYVRADLFHEFVLSYKFCNSGLVGSQDDICLKLRKNHDIVRSCAANLRRDNEGGPGLYEVGFSNLVVCERVAFDVLCFQPRCFEVSRCSGFYGMPKELLGDWESCMRELLGQMGPIEDIQSSPEGLLNTELLSNDGEGQGPKIVAWGLNLVLNSAKIKGLQKSLKWKWKGDCKALSIQCNRVTCGLLPKQGQISDNDGPC